MSNRMDIKSWRKSRNGKAYAIRLGSTWTNEKGVTYLEFDALPLPDAEGRVSCFLEEPRERAADGAQGFARQMAPSGPALKSGGGGAAKPAARDILQDDVPF